MTDISAIGQTPIIVNKYAFFFFCLETSEQYRVKIYELSCTFQSHTTIKASLQLQLQYNYSPQMDATRPCEQCRAKQV